MSEPAHILIVDDHPVVRRGLRQLIEDQSDFVVAGDMGNAIDVLPFMAEHQIDLVLLDLALETAMSGIELTKQIGEYHPETPVLLLSMHDETLYAERALAAGARGYLMKRIPDEQLIAGIRRVLQGRLAVSDTIRERLFPLEAGTTPEAVSDPTDRLSDRELQVFMLISEGYEPRHIADRLTLSVKTVNTHRRHLKQKLNMSSADELRRYAIAWSSERNQK